MSCNYAFLSTPQREECEYHNGQSMLSETGPSLQQSNWFIMPAVSSSEKPNPNAFWPSECFYQKFVG